MATATVPRTGRTMAEPPPPREPTLWELHDSLDVPGHRAEILGGRIIVSPVPSIRHGQIVTWLIVALNEVCVANGWNRLPQTTLDLPATEERVVPDLLVYPDDESVAAEWLVPAGRALLVAEVVSPNSRRTDYEDKWASFSGNAIPIYLIIDPFEVTLTLCTEPGDQGYRTIHSLDVGGKLELPEPFGITLDTATMPVRSGKA